MLTSGAFGYMLDYWLWWLMLFMLILHTWCFFRFFPRKTHRKSALVLGNGLVFLCLLGIAGIIGETYFRFIAVETDSFGMSLPARRWFVVHTTLNSYGCRDKEWSPAKPPGVRRIAFVGDSFTYGWGVENVADRFSDRIQREFESHQPGSTEILNVAKPGWGTHDQKGPIANLIRQFDIDEIVLCHVPNDIEKRIPRDEGFDPLRPPEPVLFDPDRSCLLDHLYRRIWVPRVPTVRDYHDWLAAGYDDPTSWSAHRRDLADIIQFCRENDRLIRIVLLPYLRTGGEKYDAKGVHARLADYFRNRAVPVIDLLPSLDGQDIGALVVNSFDAHPNESAHEHFARAIWDGFYETQ